MVPAPAFAAAGLPIERDATFKAIGEAAHRLGLPVSLRLLGCSEKGNDCKFDAGQGVQVLAMQRASSRLSQLEVGWDNDKPASVVTSGTLFRNVCKAIVAAVRPDWTPDQVVKMADQLVLLRPSKQPGDEVEVSEGDLVFYGSRIAPDDPDFPGEAAVECGVTTAADDQ